MQRRTLQRIVEEIVPLAAAPCLSEHMTLERYATSRCHRPALFWFQHASSCASCRRPAAAGSACDGETHLRRSPKISRRAAFGIRYSSACTASCCSLIPVKNPARLPLVFTDEHGPPLVLHAGSVLSYRDVALLSQRVVVHRNAS